MSKIQIPMGPPVRRLVVETDAKNQTRVKLQKTGPTGVLQDGPCTETELLIILLNIAGSTVNGMHMRALQQMGILTPGGNTDAAKTTD